MQSFVNCEFAGKMNSQAYSRRWAPTVLLHKVWRKQGFLWVTAMADGCVTQYACWKPLKGRLPDIASPSRDSPLNIKHKVAHQIWGSEVPCPTFLAYRGLRMSPCMQPKKPGFELLMSYRNRGKALLKRLQRQWDYESKLGSSEDSGTDRFSSNTSGSSGRKFKWFQERSHRPRALPRVCVKPLRQEFQEGFDGLCT